MNMQILPNFRFNVVVGVKTGKRNVDLSCIKSGLNNLTARLCVLTLA